MLRSFHYAAYTPLFGGDSPLGDPSPFMEWARVWFTWVSARFLGDYIERAAGASFLPATDDERDVLLDTLVLEKAVYELLYEINNRPRWLKIPVLGVTQLVEGV
jgi:maltose alpha-D-glucosyltransferase/alpha-amylase